MRRAFGAVLALGLAGIVVYLALGDGDHAFSLGTISGGPIADVAPGRTVCQNGIDVPATGAFSSLSVPVAGQASFRAVVRGGGRVLARGGGQPADIRVRPKVPGGAAISVCLTNAGRQPVAVVGGELGAAPRTGATLAGRPIRGDLELAFRCGCDRSRLEALPDTVRNAGLFKFQGAGDGWGILFALILLIGFPGSAWLALGRSRREP